ncbi:transposase [Enterococcus eurekensis]|uniref:Transposase n=1 Tax=Enterococcus eurekensis TaxID=1159753 RepID=A0ABV9M1S6_9ENTE
MDNNTRKMLGLTDENITFPENWLEDAKIKGVTAQLISGSLTYEAVQLLHYYRKKKDIDGFFSTIQTLDKALPKWFRKKLYFLKKYKQGIQNAFELSYSNGVTEGLNNKIKLIKRVSYGYRNFYHLRDRIYIIQGLIFAPTEA